jgi:hypothetical protein
VIEPSRGQLRENNLPGGVWPVEMLLGGMDSRDEHLRNELQRLLREQLVSIGSGRFAIPESFNLMAAADRTNTLDEDCVCVLVEGAAQLGRVAIYKSPGIHPGDVRLTHAVEPTEAMRAHLQFSLAGQSALIFSTKGRRSMADMIAGSDVDGDTFCVIRNEALLAHLPKECMKPWEKTAPPATRSKKLKLPSELSSHQLQTAMAAHYYHCAKADELTKRIATLWKAFTDEQPGAPPQPARLAHTATRCEPAD